MYLQFPEWQWQTDKQLQLVFTHLYSNCCVCSRQTFEHDARCISGQLESEENDVGLAPYRRIMRWAGRAAVCTHAHTYTHRACQPATAVVRAPIRGIEATFPTCSRHGQVRVQQSRAFILVCDGLAWCYRAEGGELQTGALLLPHSADLATDVTLYIHIFPPPAGLFNDKTVAVSFCLIVTKICGVKRVHIFARPFWKWVVTRELRYVGSR